MGGFFSLNMAHEIVKIVLEESYPYEDFMSWYESLASDDKEFWQYLAKLGNRSEANTELLTKKAMELYCLEMGIDYIPNNEEYLEKIYRRLVNNINVASMIERGLVAISAGKLSFIDDAKLYITDRGKKFQLKVS